MESNCPHSTSSTYPAIGQAAVQYKFITKKQLDDALDNIHTEHEAGRSISLEDHLIKIGLIDKITMSKLIAATIRTLDKQFGLIAVSSGFVAQKDVDTALAIQKKRFKHNELLLISDILINSGYLTREQRDLVLQKQNEESHPPTQAQCQSDDKKESKTQADHASPEENELEKPELVTSLPHLKAEVIVPETLSDRIDLASIKKIISDNGIKHGIVCDSIIEKQLISTKSEKLRITIAKGTAPKPCRHAEIKMHFQKDYLNPGKITDDGTIDFRDRGSVPFVKSGDLLAEKIPAKAGEPGIDIFEDAIPTDPPNDINIYGGSGTSSSEDGLKIFAAIDGQPMINVHGEVSVFTELTLPGDVDFTTGNIQFDGNIIVKGAVKEGFIVKGGSLTAREIIGSTIDVTGNVDVSGGIIGSEISAGGAIQSMYMSDSKTDSYGDVKIKKEIIDCTIYTSGACSGERTKIISSFISARQGIDVARIGTDVSQPCVLKVGTTDHTEKKVRHLQQLFEEEKSTLSACQKKMEEQENSHIKLHTKIGELNKKIEQILEKRGSIEKQLNNYRNNPVLSDSDNNNLASLETVISKLDTALTQFEGEVSTCFKDQALLTEKILTHRNHCEALIGTIETLNTKVRDIRSWAKANKPVPIVKALKEIYAKTSVTAPNSAMILDENIKNSCIQEMERVGKSYSGWEMKIISNKI